MTHGSYDQAVDIHVVAHLLDVSRSTIYRMIADGQLAPPIKVRRSSKWLKSDVEACLQKMRRGLRR